MRVPISWLRDYVAMDMPLTELATKLSVAAAEIEGIETRGVADEGGNLGLFRIGKVVEAIKHPNADRLQLTKVDLGEAEPRSIVCGAWNFGVGATVAVALPGATLPARPGLPDGLTLERRKVRGEISDGMILAEDEIGLGADHEGIMVFPEIEPGTPLADIVPLSDKVLLVEATGNRPDLQSIYGIAREIAAIYDLDLAQAPGLIPVGTPGGPVKIQVDDFERCSRYVGTIVQGVTVGHSPLIMKARLLGAGMRPISNVVDITNYVMLTLGSPLHAFDLATLQGGGINVRRAGDGEKLTTLDGVERALTSDDLVIADDARAVALAGIMGGEATEVSADTHTILLEAANFESHGVFRSSERHRLRSEASSRFEKGVDPHLADQAARWATELIVEFAGGTWTSWNDVHAGLPARPFVDFRPERADAVIGVETAPDEQFRILGKLGFEQEGAGVIVPSWRARDVTREIDVVEEIARFRLEEVPFTLPQRREMFGVLTREQKLRRRLEDALVGLGFAETYTPSLRPDDETTWKLPEPISVDLTALRTTILPSLVEAVARNIDAGAKNIALFEVARVYLPGDGDLPTERVRVAGIVEGGFARAKGVVETVYAALKAEPQFARGEHRLLHPGKAATTGAGIVGELHPRELDGEWGAFELDLDDLFAASREPITYTDVITYPAVRQDIAVVVGEDVAAGDIVAAARAAAGAELREIRVFDVYRGEQLGAGKKSVAFSVAYQADDRTLNDEDATRLRDAIINALAAQFAAELRA